MRTGRTECGRDTQQGVSLIEVLVALFVLAFGMLGIAGMQTMAMKANQSAFERNAVVISANSIAERMRSNQAAARSGSYNRTMPTGACTAPSGTDRVSTDIQRWLGELNQNLAGSGACGAINCAGTPAACRITLRWDDSRVANGGASQTFEVDVRI
ncbi:type IV pilus modification protein PilV [Methyloversatilis universalis]|uniref:type IV pilus modification protein PilV n=1 Tax=Methyloversatilis universalis TaxID=378211 RepID=UPI0003712093|nr:type IV pilus modification protein PilV [Methyloversatilis universalis]